jgi:hypothetical protein
MKKSEWKAIKYSIIAILIGLISWSMYKVINTGIGDLLLMFGIENIYLQNTIIILICVFVLLIAGMSGRKILKRVSK